MVKTSDSSVILLSGTHGELGKDNVCYSIANCTLLRPDISKSVASLNYCNEKEPIQADSVALYRFFFRY